MRHYTGLKIDDEVYKVFKRDEAIYIDVSPITSIKKGYGVGSLKNVVHLDITLTHALDYTFICRGVDGFLNSRGYHYYSGSRKELSDTFLDLESAKERAKEMQKELKEAFQAKLSELKASEVEYKIIITTKT